MQIIHIDNSNIRGSGIGGIVSYIRDVTINNSVDFKFVGSGYPLYNNFIQVTKQTRSNLFFFLKLFFIQFKLPNNENTIYHIHEAYMRLPFMFFRKSKFVLTFHGHKHDSIKSRKNRFFYLMYELLTRKLINTFDGFVSDSDEIYNFYAERYRITNGKKISIPVSVDLNIFIKEKTNKLRDRLHISKNEKIVLFVGRIVYEKNIELLLESFEICSIKYNKDYKLLIGGEGFELENIKHMAAKLKSNDRIKFLGKLSVPEVVEYMSISDIFTITSFREGGPIVLKEALSCSLKVVSVPVGDVPKVLPFFNGSIVTSYDPEVFALAMIEALSFGDVDYSNERKQFSKEFFQKDINSFYTSILNKT